jgi:hypothetical protein
MTHTSAAQSSLAGRNFNCFTHTHTHATGQETGVLEMFFFPRQTLKILLKFEIYGRMSPKIIGL